MDKKVFYEIRTYIIKNYPKNSYYNRAIIKYALECVDRLEEYTESNKEASLKQNFKLSNVIDYPSYIDYFIRTNKYACYSSRDIIKSTLDDVWQGCCAFDFRTDKIAECLPPSKRTFANIQRMTDDGYTRLLLRSYDAFKTAVLKITNQDVYKNDVEDQINRYLERNDVNALHKCLAIDSISRYIKDEQLAQIKPL